MKPGPFDPPRLCTLASTRLVEGPDYIILLDLGNGLYYTERRASFWRSLYPGGISHATQPPTHELLTSRHPLPCQRPPLPD